MIDKKTIEELLRAKQTLDELARGKQKLGDFLGDKKELLDDALQNAQRVYENLTARPVKAGVVGATGYAGIELVRLLLGHPHAELAAVSSVSYEGKPLAEVYPALYQLCDLTLVSEDEVIAASDVVFASLPHGLCEPIAKKCLARGARFIDLGADFRLADPAAYKQWYGLDYREPELHKQAAYCIPELHRARVTPAVKILANPGCYPTSIALGLAPVLRAGLGDLSTLVIDSKSGATGAGRGLALNTHFPECSEAFGPYKVAAHRHTPEIEQTLSELAGAPVAVTFVPHLLPLNRGIVSTLYLRILDSTSLNSIFDLYKKYYAQEPFVRILPPGQAANVKNVRCSNYCDISLHPDARTGRLVVVAALDNMGKGAAGQAVQNMNLWCGFPETEGLGAIPPAI